MIEVEQALIHRYGPASNNPATANHAVDTDLVADFLFSLNQYPDQGSLRLTLSNAQPDWNLDDLTIATLASIEDCMTLIFRITQMAPHVNDQLRSLAAIIAAHLLRQPDLPFSSKSDLFEILDALNRGMVGWAEGLGAGSNKLQTVFDDAVEKLREPGADLSGLNTDLTKFMTKEADKIKRLEDRLAASETGLVRSKQAQTLAATLINEKCTGKLVTDSLATFLKGPWYDSLQLLVNKKGIDNDEWHRANAITETILWSYQPIEAEANIAAAAKQKLFSIIEALPTEIRQLLVALEHNTDATEATLQDIENDHVSIASGIAPDYIDFEPIPTEASPTRSKVSRVLLRKVRELETGHWFSYTEGTETQSIKLVLKLDDVNQLLFTNRNGMKVLQRSFDEFAYYLSSRVVKRINPDAAFSSTFSSYFQGMLNEYQKHKQLISERKAEVDRLDEERRKAQEKAQREAEKLAIEQDSAEKNRAEALKVDRLENAKAEAAKSENSDRLNEFTTAVESLAAGAIVFLPDALGEQQECKLAVRIAAADKMIFVDRNGMKAGDYQAVQLVELLVAGDAELGDQGVEFEDTLAAVVSKLRSDREKSYDDLTGT